MNNLFNHNAKTLKTWLIILFSVLSTVMIFLIIAISYATMEWTESEVAKKRIYAYTQEAIDYFTENPTKNILITKEHIIYNDINFIPQEFRKYFEGESDYFEEITNKKDGKNYFLDLKEYNTDKKKFKIYTILLAYNVEEEAIVSLINLVIIIAFIILFYCIVLILKNLYKSLFNPIHILKTQLDESQGNPRYSFEIPENSLIEFHDLINQLNKNNLQIDSLIKREQAFARYASHELRTPLTSIIGSNALLEKSDHNDFQARQIMRIKSASKQMSAIVDLLLSLVRYEKNKAQDEPRQITKNELNRIINSYTEQAHPHSLTNQKVFGEESTTPNNLIHLNVESLPLVTASEIVVDVIVGNLIKNALIATKSNQKAPEILLTLTNSVLTVQDNGNGLNHYSSQEQSVFVTVEEDLQSKLLPSHGFGLGLLIVNELCQRYSWKFTLENQASGGCIAKIEFPQ